MGSPRAVGVVNPAKGRRERLRIVVSGMLASVPGQGGATWAALQYVLGLMDLGHDVLFVEPAPCSESSSGPAAAYFRRVTAEFGFADRAALIADGRSLAGVPYPQCRRFASSADLLVNLSGTLQDPALLEPIERRLYVDLDPAFTQLWNAAEGVDMGFDRHTEFATVGLLLDDPACGVPRCGRAWIPTVQPLVLDHWTPGDSVRWDAFTTVANWRGYGSLHHEGIHYGQKAHSVRRLMDLPSRAGARVTLALSIHADETDDIEALHRGGWEWVDPASVAHHPTDYQDFVRGSMAELGIAKTGYTASRCGWFSDRSVCYLASGRPVVAEETGFSERLPTGEGLLAFSTSAEAADRMDDVCANYAAHRRWARDLAESLFDSRVVLDRLVQRVGVSA